MTENYMHTIELSDKSHTLIHVDSDVLMALIAAGAVTHKYHGLDLLDNTDLLDRSGWVADKDFLHHLNRLESNDGN